MRPAADVAAVPRDPTGLPELHATGPCRGTGAELVTTVANFFLEDTTTYYRVYSTGRDVEVFVDSHDRGNPGLSHYFCPIPDTDLSFEPPSC